MKKTLLILLIFTSFIAFSSFVFSQSTEDYEDIVLKIAIGMVERGIEEDGDTILYKRVRPGIILQEGEYLKTSDDSNATLKIGEDILKVEENTSLILKYVEDGGTELNILSGSILTKVKKLTEGGSFNVNSPSAVAGVRGTSFRFSYDRKSTTGAVYVSEGSVEVGNDIVKNKSVLLNRNERISIKRGDDPTEAEIEEVVPIVRKKSAEDIENIDNSVISLDIYDKEIEID